MRKREVRKEGKKRSWERNGFSGDRKGKGKEERGKEVARRWEKKWRKET